MLNEIAVVRVELLKLKDNVQSVDTNSNPDLILLPLCGMIPNQAQIVNGTVAISGGFITKQGVLSGKMQLVHIVEREQSAEYGRQFSVAHLSEITPAQLPEMGKAYGKGEVLITKAKEKANDTPEGKIPQLNTSNAPKEEAPVKDLVNDEAGK